MIAALERRDPVERPSPSRGAAIASSSSSRWSSTPVGQLARERRGVASSSVVERAAGDVALVEGEDGGAALVGSRMRCRRATAQARETYSPERVSTRTRSPTFDEQRHLDRRRPVSSVAGLVPPPEAVSPLHAGLGLR